VYFNQSGSINASYNVTSISDNAIGDWTVNFTTAMSSASYCGVGLPGKLNGAGLFMHAFSISASGFRVQTRTADGVEADPGTLGDAMNAMFVACFGDHA